MSRNSLYYSWDASVSLKYVNIFKRRKKGQKMSLCKLVNSLDLFVRSPSTGYTFERCRRYDSELPKIIRVGSSRGIIAGHLLHFAAQASMGSFPLLHCITSFFSNSQLWQTS